MCTCNSSRSEILNDFEIFLKNCKSQMKLDLEGPEGVRLSFEYATFTINVQLKSHLGKCLNLTKMSRFGYMKDIATYMYGRFPEYWYHPTFWERGFMYIV